MGRVIIGRVTSDKADKTIVISAATQATHPLYKKRYTINRRYMAHDEKNQAKVGDRVSIAETRPISSKKRFILSRIIERHGVKFEETDATADVAELLEKQEP